MLNIPRLHFRSVNSYMRALEFTRGGQLPFILFDAIAMSEDEAGYLQQDANVQRVINETLAEVRKRR